MSKVFCSKCRHILGPPYTKKAEALCCATETPVIVGDSDWYEERTITAAEGRVLCSQRNVLNNCVYYEEKMMK